MKKLIATIVAAAAFIGILPVLSGCSQPSVEYTLYGADGTSKATYTVDQNPSGEDEIEAEEGSYFVVTGHSGNVSEVVIPATYGGVPVTGIGDQAFENSRYLTSVKMADSITSMGIGCFLFCIRLTDVTLSSGLTTVSQSAFAYCSLLTDITIPEGVTTIGYRTFFYSGLETVSLPESLVTITDGAFERCYSLTAITLPSGVQKIGSSAFLSCTTLTTLDIPDSVTSIGFAAFQNCTALTQVTLGSGLTYLGGYSFCYCLTLESITIPADVEYIGENAFAADSALANVYISNQFSDGSDKACYLYTADLSEEENENGYESGYLAPGSENAESYLYDDYNYYSHHDGSTAGVLYYGRIPKGSLEEPEYMAQLLTTVLAGNTNLGSDSDISVYWYFVKA